MDAAATEAVFHATTVAAFGQGLLIRGVSGSGKSSLALRLLALGAVLVSDDRTCVRRAGQTLIASPPATIAGLIEARGVGILRARHMDAATLTLIADLDLAETERLPPRRFTGILGVELPVVHGAGHADLAPALMQYLREGRDA